ncbi:MAG: peptide chain release factor N(5)-glutamine methyltransferase [Thermoplasmata archaeon]|nr:peptide chain release factor N(5)-glutamine methyltransferase [Thermoplasmata archaeon]
MKKPLIQIIREAKGELPQADIYLLLAYALGRRKEFLLTYPQYFPTRAELEKWEEYRKRRLKGEPVSYITGEKEFYSLVFRVNRSTLIPRPESELLIDEVLLRRPSNLLDIGTGSGNIAISVKYHLPECRIVALDNSEKVLLTASQNACRLLGRHDIKFIKSDYFSELRGKKFNVIVSNPPYIKSGSICDLAAEIRLFEPGMALDGGPDGLNAYRSILNEGRKFLEPEGRIILEIDPELLNHVLDTACNNRYRVEKIAKDLRGDDRVVVLY